MDGVSGLLEATPHTLDTFLSESLTLIQTRRGAAVKPPCSTVNAFEDMKRGFRGRNTQGARALDESLRSKAGE